MEWLTKFPEMDRNGLMEFKKTVDNTFTSFILLINFSSIGQRKDGLLTIIRLRVLPWKGRMAFLVVSTSGSSGIN